MIHPFQTEASGPIIKSGLLEKHPEWVSLKTVKVSITVILYKVQAHLEEDGKSRDESALFPICVTAEGTGKQVCRISGLSRQLLCHNKFTEKDKTLSSPAIKSDNKLSTSKT